MQRRTTRPAPRRAPAPGAAPAPDITNLATCAEEARDAALDSDTGPTDPTDFHDLRGRLQAARDKLPPLYRTAAVDPYIATLDSLGLAGFNQILVQDPKRERL